MGPWDTSLHVERVKSYREFTVGRDTQICKFKILEMLLQ